jgi:predicted  nucleic acid-binding Zn-ribbon protein
MESRMSEPVSESSLIAALLSHMSSANPAVLDSRLSRVESDIGELRVEIKELRREIKEDMTSLRSEIKGDMDSLRSESKNDIASLRSEMHTQFYILLGFLVAMLGAMAKGFQWI